MVTTVFTVIHVYNYTYITRVHAGLFNSYKQLTLVNIHIVHTFFTLQSEVVYLYTFSYFLYVNIVVDYLKMSCFSTLLPYIQRSPRQRDTVTMKLTEIVLFCLF